MYWLVVLVATVSGAYAQLTAQSSVAPDLRECYNNGTLLDRNNLPPTTIPVLIDLIRKVEESNPNKDLRELAVLLLHTYRQDGIEYHQPENNGVSSYVLPFAPTFHSFHRHRLLLTRLLPSNLQTLSNDTISSVYKCALHHMLSTTVDARVRGDENNCNQLSQYRALRTARQAPSISDDVEILDPALLNSANEIGQIRQYDPNNDIEYTSFGGSKYERQLLGESQCPLLDGVVKSAWGALSAGNLIAGIAAGAQNQQVALTELMKGSTVTSLNTQLTVTSIYPATLSGDLAEAALIQGTERVNPSISIGTAGSWNSTQATKHYMIHSRTNIEMTDPEIRGDIDGFVLGTTLSSTLGTYGSLKLSQLIDMYYSARNGVFNSALRACNRRELSQQYISNANLISETYAFAIALDTNMPLKGTITGGLQDLVNSAVTNFQTYTTQNLNDLSCVITENSSKDYRLKTNLYLVVDSTWQYQAVYPAISFILDSIDVNKYGSSVTLLNSFDGSVVINKTFSLADFHTQYTISKHQAMLTGVNLQTTLTNIQTLMFNELQHERTTNYVGGNSTVLLFLLNSGNLQNNDETVEQARILRERVPDLRIIFATSTNQLDTLSNLVRDPNNDIRTVSLNTDGTNVDLALEAVIERVEQVGRRIINPNCGSDYASDSTSGTRQFNDYVEPGYINFYSISPNYFYRDNENTRIRISRVGSSVGSLHICYSREVTQPRQNATIVGLDENAIQCQTLGNSGNVELNLHDACSGHSTISSCPFYYLSVQSSTESVTSLTASCTDNACRFPYNIAYQVQIAEFRCFNGGRSIAASFVFIFSAFFITVLRLH